MRADESEERVCVIVYGLCTAAQRAPVKKEYARLLQCTGTRGPKSVRTENLQSRVPFEQVALQC